MDHSSKAAKVLILQFEPAYKDPTTSIQRAESIIKQFSEEDAIDIVLLPEIAFAGYIFKSREDIMPYLEKANQGPTYEFCKKWAVTLKAYVVCGYAEAREVSGSTKYYNSQLWVAPDGSVVHNYAKHFLFTADETWAEEGPAFQAVNLTMKSGLELKVGCGICMDIMPYKFTAPFTDYELSSFYEKEKCDLVLFSTGWVTANPAQLANEEAARTGLHNYWISRLTPLVKGERKVYFCAANRTGSEGGFIFQGLSCFIKIEPKQKPEEVSSLGVSTQGFLLESLQY